MEARSLKGVEARFGASNGAAPWPLWACWMLLFLGLVLEACQRPERSNAEPVEATSSRIDVFLRCVDGTAAELGFGLVAVEVGDENGGWRPLSGVRREVLSKESAGRLQLAGAIVPPGRYVSLRLTLDRAWIQREGERRALTLELPQAAGSEGAPADPALPGATQSYSLPLDLSVRSRDAASVFLDWRATDSLRGGLGFLPRFTSSLERPQTFLGMLYVADAGSGSVLGIDRASGQVVSTVKAGAEPRALALSLDRRRLCVANAGDGSLSVLDLRRGHVESSSAVGFSAGTCDVVLADGGRLVALANAGQDSVSFLIFGSGGVVQNVPVGRGPTRLASADSLARIFVCESGNDSISVIDANSRSVVAQVAVESAPTDVELDRDERELYVSHRTSPNLVVLDARSLARTATLFVGGDVTDLLADPGRSRIYVARSNPPEIVVVERRLGSIVRRIPLDGRVESMALSLDGAELFAAAPDQGSVVVIDLVLGRRRSAIRCGTRPMDVVIAQ